MGYNSYENKKDQKERMKIKASMLTAMDLQIIEKYENILKTCTAQSYFKFYESQLNKEKYKKFYSKLVAPIYDESKLPSYEQIKKELGVPKKNVLEILFKSKIKIRENKEKEAEELFVTRTKEYKNKIYDEQKLYEQELEREKELYNKEKAQFEKNKLEHNNDVNNKKQKYLAGNSDEVEEFNRYVLKETEMDIDDKKEFDVQYLAESKTLIVSYYLPNSDKIPNIIQHKFVQTRMQIEPVKMTEKKFEKFYNNIIYMHCLRTINEIIRSDEENIIDNVVYNGWVKYIDKSNGKNTESCIITINVSKEKFLDINLENVDCKECIKGLKGIFAPNILSLTPVIPYMSIDRHDNRFVEVKEVSNIMLDGFNLATMPWEDFEYFVRELFDKMFNVNGGEVKVTQASHDGGVDAIAFDDDPIRGGKFVIQAKRYNNVVPVSAVRDLYGTMIHEGATKGILVTTSFYGKESYDFSKDKPITLIDGQALLGLLNKYGYTNLTIKIKK